MNYCLFLSAEFVYFWFICTYIRNSEVSVPEIVSYYVFFFKLTQSCHKIKTSFELTSPLQPFRNNDKMAVSLHSGLTIGCYIA